MNIFEIFAQLPHLVAMPTAGTILLTNAAGALAKKGDGGSRDSHDGTGDSSSEPNGATVR